MQAFFRRDAGRCIARRSISCCAARLRPEQSFFRRTCRRKKQFDLIPSSSDDGTLRGSCTRFQAFLLFRQAEACAPESVHTPFLFFRAAEGRSHRPCRKAPHRSRGGALSGVDYSSISMTTPEPTVRPPSRIAKRRPFSMAMGVISSTFMSTLSPGMHISVPSGRVMTPVTSVVRK